MKFAILALALLSTNAFASNKRIIQASCPAQSHNVNSDDTYVLFEVIHRVSEKGSRYELTMNGRLRGVGQFTAGAGTISDADFAALKDARSPELEISFSLFNGHGYDSINRYNGRLTVRGSLERPDALSLDLERTGLEGTNPVSGPARLALTSGCN